MILMLILGSVHAFSVFLEPLEAEFSVSRSLTSATYSISLVCLTVSVLIGHHVFKRLNPSALALVLCLVAAVGCLAAGNASSIYAVWIGYGAVFGAANGIGYALSLQTAAQANPDNKGLAVGIITACYALGAAFSPYLFDLAIARSGFSGAMFGLAGTLIVAGILVCVLFKSAGSQLQVANDNAKAEDKRSVSLLVKLWICYGTAVFGGLMIIGHATGIMRIVTANDTLVLLAPVAVALFNMLGSLSGGFLADRLPLKRLLITLPVISAVALAGLLLTKNPVLVLAFLGVVGLAYGAIISVYPVAVSDYFGALAGVSAYGKVFTAWGTAGLAGPILAGGLYEAFDGYQQAMLLAGVSGIISSAFALGISRPRTPVA